LQLGRQVCEKRWLILWCCGAVADDAHNVQVPASRLGGEVRGCNVVARLSLMIVAAAAVVPVMVVLDWEIEEEDVHIPA
jgi:hypothetical protein